MKDEFLKEIGIWGQRHYNYLKRTRITTINVMRMNGTLKQYLTDLDRDAQDMFDMLVEQLAQTDGITEQLKADNQLEWVCRMNACREQATEIVNKELIFA